MRHVIYPESCYLLYDVPYDKSYDKLYDDFLENIS